MPTWTPTWTVIGTSSTTYDSGIYITSPWTITTTNGIDWEWKKEEEEKPKNIINKVEFIE